MAGVGFVLRRLARQDTLTSGLRAHLHATGIACGPWLFTVIALAGIELTSAARGDVLQRSHFSIIVIYNFIFSLVLAGPLVMVVTRHLADRIYARNVLEVPGMLVGALVVLFAAQLAVAVPFYGFIVDLPPPGRLLAISGFLIVGGIWVATAFLSALKSYETVSMAFLVGMATAFGMATLLGPSIGALGMLAGFNLGLALTFYVLVARVLAEFPYPVRDPLGFLDAFVRYWPFALAGLFYNAGTWVDKWIMWMSPGRMVFAGAMPAHPDYDAAMFLAFLTVVPAMALFLVMIETRFFETYLAFYRGIARHGTIGRIHTDHQAIVRSLLEGTRNVAILQTAVSYLAIVAAPMLVALAGCGPEVVPIFRFGVLGALFHVLLLFTLVIISYFDLRRLLVSATLVFFVLNAVLTLATLVPGHGYYGYGYFIAAVVSLIYAASAAAWQIGRLPYVTFVSNNRGLR